VPVPVLIRRAVTLLLLSLFAPGSAQLAVGDRRIGRIVLRVWAGLIGTCVLIGLLALLSRSFVLSVFTQPFVLILTAVVMFALALAWPLVILDAWRLARVGRLPTRSRVAVCVLAVSLVLGTGVTMLETGRRVWAGADLISGMFGSGQASAAVDGRYNVLLLGGDAGRDRIGVRPDSMTLASIDAETGRTVLFSLPRNLENVHFPAGSAPAKALPNGWSCGDSCLLNALYTWGGQHKDLFPGVADPGAAAMKLAVQGVTGLTVNHYVLIDLRGFNALIDAMGGITVTVRQPVPIGGETSKISRYIQPGTRHLNGYEALWFARSRTGASDYARMARQRCVMDAMAQQLDPATVLRNFQGIAAAGRNVISTDLAAGELGTFLDLATKAKAQKIISVQFVPPLITPARPDFGLIRAKVVDTVRRSEQQQDEPAGKPSKAAGGAPASAAGGTSARATAAAGQPVADPPAETGDIRSVCSPGGPA